jgi:transposase InsO family protein
MAAWAGDTPARVRWARLRFSAIGALLMAPPKQGELRKELGAIAERYWPHPMTGEPVRFSVPTLERWYYAAKNAPTDPIAELERKVRKDAGNQPSVGSKLRCAIKQQHKDHPRWSYQLHHDNLVALAKMDRSLGAVPSYATVRRYMKSQGLLKRKRRRKRRGGEDNRELSVELVAREKRSFEIEHAHGLWHSDYHEGSLKVLTPRAEWVAPQLLAILDDCSRYACHLQWYFEESSETFVHGFCQAVLKRGLPRGFLSDNGGAFTAAECEEGLERLSIRHWTTLPYTPEQNAKSESFWGQIEGRLLPMLENERELTLDLLNRATQAWVELEYNRTLHSELGMSPLERLLAGPSVGRESPSTERLKQAFRMERKRTQRRSDGTISVMSKRFELPTRYRALLRPTVRYARWDLSTVDLIDPHTGEVVCTLLPLDKHKNAEGRRRALEPIGEPPEPVAKDGIAPLLSQLMADYAATGLPPAFLPFNQPEKTDE